MRESGAQFPGLDKCVNGDLLAEIQRKYRRTSRLVEEDGDVHFGHEASRWRCLVGSRIHQFGILEGAGGVYVGILNMGKKDPRDKYTTYQEQKDIKLWWIIGEYWILEVTNTEIIAILERLYWK